MGGRDNQARAESKLIKVSRKQGQCLITEAHNNRARRGLILIMGAWDNGARSEP